jgi:hypothetical protein
VFPVNASIPVLLVHALTSHEFTLFLSSTNLLWRFLISDGRIQRREGAFDVVDLPGSHQHQLRLETAADLPSSLDV